MLSFARRQSYEPGSNLEGEQAENVWLFLLPSLELRRVVAVGSPSNGTRISWNALGAEVTEVAAGELPAALANRCELVWIGSSTLSAVAADPAALGALDRFLGAGGSVYVEPSRRAARLVARFAESLAVTTSVELAEARTQQASSSGALHGRAAWFVPRSRALPSPIVRRVRRVLGRLCSRLSPASPGGGLIGAGPVREGVSEASSDQGLLVRGNFAGTQLPGYIRAVARQNGYELEDMRWSIGLQRGYRSQKVVFHVPDAGAIVKVTQDPRFNHRLENEYDALRILQQQGLTEPSLAPQALFSGSHGRVLVVGESRLGGAPFRDRSDGSPSCRVARAVVDALTVLASASAGTGPGGGRHAAEALMDLLARHSEIHRPPADHLRFLEHQIGRLAEAGDDLHPVFLHGDLTTLNILVDRDRIGLVDWENAEPAGLPLWDLLHFVGAYAAWGAQRAGRRWTARTAQAALLEPSPFHTMLGDAIARYRIATGLQGELIPPLLFTWWMTVALREATRRRPDRVNGGLYARLLARAVAAGETPALRQLAVARDREGVA
jgi:aminoglycoside phosphotransferase (APT) family kinase protein